MLVVEPQDDEEIAKETLEIILNRLESPEPGVSIQKLIDEIISMRH
jgi:hypothetical protein